MTIVEAAPWMRVDREALLACCADVISADGGLLIAVGDESSGRNEAARIAVSYFVDAGLRAHRVLDAGDRPNSFRYVLESIANWAVAELGLTGPGLSVAASNVSVSIERLSGYCVQTLQTLKNSASSPLAFVVSAFEQGTSFGPADVKHMARLIESVGGCWVIISQESKLWLRIPCQVVKLGMFTRQDVADALRKVIEKNGGDLRHVPDYLDKIFASGVTSITPLHAYYHLQQVSAAPGSAYWQQ